MDRILITGSKGFIGSRLEEYLKGQDEEVWTLDIRGSGERHFEESVTEFQDFAEFDTIYHLAALSNPRYCERNREKAWRVNVEGTRNILKQLTSEQEIIFTSSAHVYGRRQGKRKEDDSLNPDNFYGLTKKISEELIQNSSQRKGFEHTIFRLFNVYGPGQEEGFLVPDVIRRARRSDSLEVKDPESKISPIYIDDVVEVITEGLSGNIYNVSNDCVAVEEIYRLIGASFGTKLKHTEITGEPSVLCGDNSRVNSAIDIEWTPIKEGLAKSIGSKG